MIGIKLLGFVEKQVLAYFFGATQRVDAYFVAISVPTAVFLMIRQLIEPTFLPLFVRDVQAGREARGWRMFTAVASGLAVLAGAVAVVASLCGRPLAAFLAPGFASATSLATARLIRIMAPAGVLLGLSALTYITLNSYRRFVVPALGDLAWKSVPILACVLLAARHGIEVLAWGFLGGCLLRLGVHLAGLGRKLHCLSWPRKEDRGQLRELTVLMLPLLAAVLFSQLGELGDNFFASGLAAGSVAARIYARRIVDLPILIVPYALSVVLYPHFAHWAARGETDRLHRALSRSVRGLALVFAAVAVTTVLLAGPVVTLLLERGAFDARARLLTVLPLRLYGIGLVTLAVETVLVPFYFSLKDTATPVMAGIIGVLVHLALNVVLIGPLGVAGVALAFTIGKTVKVFLLALLLRRKQPHLRWRSVAGFCARLLCGSASAAVAGIGFMAWHGPPPARAGVGPQVAWLLAAGLVIGLVFMGISAALGSAERALIRSGIGWMAGLPRRGLRSR